MNKNPNKQQLHEIVVLFLQMTYITQKVNCKSVFVKSSYQACVYNPSVIM